MTPDAARRRLRRRLLLWALPVMLVAGFGGLKLVHQHVVAESAVSAYLEGDAEAALNLSSQLQWLNFVERWKPDYDIGTSLLALDALDDARSAFERALVLAAPPEQCPIRANLAITRERQGDDALAGMDAAGAMAHYEAALAVIAEQDPACDASTSNRSLDDSEVRIREKLEQLQQEQEQEQPEQGEGGEGEDGQPDPETQPNPDSLGDIENELNENQQERQDDLGGNGGGSGGPLVDEPW